MSTSTHKPETQVLTSAAATLLVGQVALLCARMPDGLVARVVLSAAVLLAFGCVGPAASDRMTF